MLSQVQRSSIQVQRSIKDHHYQEPKEKQLITFYSFEIIFIFKNKYFWQKNEIKNLKKKKNPTDLL